MKFMPDSAVLGTVGHAKRRAAKSRRRGYGLEASDMVPTIGGVVAIGWFVIALVIANYLFG